MHDVMHDVMHYVMHYVIAASSLAAAASPGSTAATIAPVAALLRGGSPALAVPLGLIAIGAIGSTMIGKLV